MAKIKQLSVYEAQKIAAGEVVERPISVVKELLENALDAHATQITLYLEEAGKKLVRVIDNGYGMSIEDARMCIQHHATSKITCIEDLEHIHTFGFRGEALSSIAAVSKISLITKEAEATTGIKLEVVEGAIANETVVSCNTGTDITIADLFYNVPARKKFLKSKEAEWRLISQLFYALCLDYPAIHFKLFSENKLIHNCPPATHLTLRIVQLYEKALAHNILLFEAQEDRMSLKINGALSDPQYSRYDRNQIFVFVNKRWVKNHKLVQALLKGYQNILQPERYPAGFLFISLDQEFVDINIHPRKEEVQFLHPRIIETLIENTVKQRIQLYTSDSLSITPLAKTIPTTTYPILDTLSPSISEYPNPIFAQPLYAQATQNTIAQSTPSQIQEKKEFLDILDNHFKISPEPLVQQTQSHLPEVQEPKLNYTLIGQILTTYIVIENDQGAVLIDQHAAHERILYEKIRSQFNTVERIKLLFPQVVSLTKNDMELILEHLSLFEVFGVLMQQASLTELIIQETPLYFKNQSVEDILQQTIVWLQELQDINKAELQKSLQEKIHAQMSCKAAVKAGDQLSSQSMHEIIKNLYALDNNSTCPHGRPTIWAISKYEIEKKFKRNYK
jgi:DNA mismatch repair protein MutL